MEILDRKGWIASPEESEEELLLRKASASEEKLFDPFNKAHDLTYKIFEFRLEQVGIFYDTKSLSPWQGALLWSYEKKDKRPFPVIQIRKKGIQNETEIVAHELVHAARFSFKEPLFEEILAYRTSSSFLYRFFGPLFLFRQEPLFFLLISFFSFFSVIYFDTLLPLKILLSVLVFFGVRLIFLQTVFELAKKNIKKNGGSNPLAVLLRLSDREIFTLAFFPFSDFLKKLKGKHRFECIYRYFNNP